MLRCSVWKLLDMLGQLPALRTAWVSQLSPTSRPQEMRTRLGSRPVLCQSGGKPPSGISSEHKTRPRVACACWEL